MSFNACFGAWAYVSGDAQGHDHHGRWECNLRQDAGVAHGTLCKNIHVFTIPRNISLYSKSLLRHIPSLGAKEQEKKQSQINIKRYRFPLTKSRAHEGKKGEARARAIE